MERTRRHCKIQGSEGSSIQTHVSSPGLLQSCQASARGARAHVDLGLGWGTVTQLLPSVGRALLSPSIPSHRRSRHLGPSVPWQGTGQFGPVCPELTKVSGLGEAARELGDESWHLEGSRGPSWYRSSPSRPGCQHPSRLAAGGRGARLRCGERRRSSSSRTGSHTSLLGSQVCHCAACFIPSSPHTLPAPAAAPKPGLGVAGSRDRAP